MSKSSAAVLSLIEIIILASVCSVTGEFAAMFATCRGQRCDLFIQSYDVRPVALVRTNFPHQLAQDESLKAEPIAISRSAL